MADEQQTSGPDPDLLETPPTKRRRSPLRRLVLLALFAATLPFDWGERSSCQGGARTFTGIDQLTENPSNGISIAVIFLVPVLLGLLQHPQRNAVARLLMELNAMVFAALGTIYCFFNAIFAGAFGSSGKLYPAPWIALLAPLLMLVDACQGAVGRIGDLIEQRAQRRMQAASEDAARRSPDA